MAKALHLDGLSVVVTGAGGGLGREHALLVARLGAEVVVNDLGTEIDGSGSASAPAEETTAMIVAAGGRAVTDVSDISEPAGARALVRTALRTHGRVDAVINNAGIDGDDAVTEITWESFRRMWEVNAGGSFLVTQAAWPHLAASGHGRVVLTASGTGVFGARRRAHYGSAKGAVAGLMRALALDGEADAIRVNGLAPAAFTCLAETYAPAASRERLAARMPAPLVSPLVAWRAHPDCDVTGRMFAAGGGRYAEIFPAETVGSRPDIPSIDAIGAAMGEITDTEGAFVPRDSGEAVVRGADLP